jgi:hypothetical protein
MHKKLQQGFWGLPASRWWQLMPMAKQYIPERFHDASRCRLKGADFLSSGFTTFATLTLQC